MWEGRRPSEPLPRSRPLSLSPLRVKVSRNGEVLRGLGDHPTFSEVLVGQLGKSDLSSLVPLPLLVEKVPGLRSGRERGHLV